MPAAGNHPKAEHPLAGHPASDFTDDLDHAARVTEEAAMDMSIAAFFVVP